MMLKPSPLKSIGIGLWMVIVLLACNLGTNPAPPTLVPRSSPTPQPTMGTLNSAPASTLPGMTGAPQAPADVQLYNLLNQVEIDLLMIHIDRLQNFGTRHVNSTQASSDRGIGAAARYIENQFKDIQSQSEGRVYTFVHEFDLNYNNVPTKQRNLVAVIQGTDPGAGTLVIGAHYDSIATPFEDAETFAPGANDNGSGVAGVIELARIMSSKSYRMSVMFVMFSAEEVGREGSRRFVNYLQEQQIDVKAMINVDTIGNYHDTRGAINGSELRLFSQGPNESSLSRQLARAANFIGFNSSLDLTLAVQDAIDRENRYGDHFSFTEAGYPAVRFINAVEEKRNADPTDTIEFVDPEYLRKSVQSLLVVAMSMADGPRPPRNIALRDQSDGSQSLHWEPVVDAVSYVVALRLPGSLMYDQQFEVPDTFVDWDGFSRYAGIAVAARDASGLVGSLSREYVPLTGS